MKTFNHLQFRQPSEPYMATRAVMFFKNGYGVSVLTGASSYSTDSVSYELAVLKGTPKQSDLCYDTPITGDVLGWQSPEQITATMRAVQSL